MRSKTKTTLLEGRVRDMVHDGSAVVETERGIVLSRGGQPGEQVLVQTGKRRRGVLRGTLKKVLEPAATRVEPFCPELEHCGGCAWGAMHISAQRRIKRDWIARAVSADSEQVDVVEGRAEGYRRRARWVWQTKRAHTQLGYRQAGSRALAEVERCSVLTESLELVLLALRRELVPHLVGDGEIEALEDRARVGLFVHALEPQPASFYRACEALLERVDGRPRIVGVVAQVEDVAPAIYGDRHMMLSIASAEGLFAVATPIGGFAQGNGELNHQLVARVLDACPTEANVIADLYAGSGNLSVALLSRRPKRLVVNESEPEAFALCKETLRREVERQQVSSKPSDNAKTKLSFVDGDASLALDRLPRAADLVVLDPPREGAGTAMMARLAALRPSRIVYVSCSPGTLERDLKSLQDYALVQATMVDMFPHTPHVEAVVVMDRK